jgi:hypothetical protein
MMSTEASEVVDRTPIAEVFARGAAVLETASQSTDKGSTDVKSSQEPAATSAVQATEVKEKAEPKAAKPEVKAETETKERARDETGRFKKEADEQIAGAQAALVAERRKRQELERQLQQQTAQKPKPDFFADPEAALNERDAKIRAEANEKFFAMSEELVKDQHKDYDAVIEAFMADAEADPTIASRTFAEMQKARNPAAFLYKAAKLHGEMKAVGGDLGKYRETVEAPLKDELAKRDTKIAELEAQLSQLGRVPASLSTEQSSTRASVEAEQAAAPMPIDQVFQPKKRRH